MSSPDGIRRVEPAQTPSDTRRRSPPCCAVDARRLGVLPLAVDDTRIVLAFSTAPVRVSRRQIAMADGEERRARCSPTRRTGRGDRPRLPRPHRRCRAPHRRVRLPTVRRGTRRQSGIDRPAGAEPHRRAARPSARCRRLGPPPLRRSATQRFASTAVATARRLRRARRRHDRAARVPGARRGSIASVRSQTSSSTRRTRCRAAAASG